MGGAMLSKSLIPLSVDGWGYVHPCYLPGAKLWWTPQASLVAQTVKAYAYNAGDPGSIPG